MTTFAAGGQLTTIEALAAPPLLTIVIDLGPNPPAWQKRAARIPEVEPETWYCSGDTDFGLISEELVDMNASFMILWLPSANA